MVQIEGFEVGGVIGRGASSVVYSARQLGVGGRPVALKVLQGVSLDDDAMRRFDRECASLGVLSGVDGIVTVFGAGRSADGYPWIAMELMDGSLAALISGGARVPWATVARIGVVVAAALGAAHERGIVHRDLKPENVLIDRTGRPRLADFGISSVSSSTATATSMRGFSGTVAHAAPELLAGGAPSTASDVYGLASTLFTLLAGHAPYAKAGEDNVLAMVRRMVSEPLPDLGVLGVPAGLASWLARALDAEPAQRPGATAFAAGLASLDGVGPAQDLVLSLPRPVEHSTAPSPSTAPSGTVMAGPVWTNETVMSPATRITPEPAGVPDTAAPPAGARFGARRRVAAIAAVAAVVLGGAGAALALDERSSTLAPAEVPSSTTVVPVPETPSSTTTPPATTTTTQPVAETVFSVGVPDGKTITSTELPNRILELRGVVNRGARVDLNGNPVSVSTDGAFTFLATLVPGENSLRFTIERAGAPTLVRTINVTYVIDDQVVPPASGGSRTSTSTPSVSQPLTSPAPQAPAPAPLAKISLAGPTTVVAGVNNKWPATVTNGVRGTWRVDGSPTVSVSQPNWNPASNGFQGTFTAVGAVYTIVLTVENADGISTSSSVTVRVVAPSPSVKLSGPTTVKAGEQANWSVSASNVVAGTWSLSGSPAVPVSRPDWSPGSGFGGTFKVVGATYTLTLTARSASGETVSSSITFTIVA